MVGKMMYYCFKSFTRCFVERTSVLIWQLSGLV